MLPIPSTYVFRVRGLSSHFKHFNIHPYLFTMDSDSLRGNENGSEAQPSDFELAVTLAMKIAAGFAEALELALERDLDEPVDSKHDREFEVNTEINK